MRRGKLDGQTYRRTDGQTDGQAGRHAGRVGGDRWEENEGAKEQASGEGEEENK